MAVTRAVSPAMDRCVLTHVARQAIDLEAARAQHAAYEQRLIAAGCSIVRLESSDDLPDSVFVEDAAVVFDELAVIARPGAVSRRAETDAVVDILSPFRPLQRIQAPATLDGGDVLVVGRHVFVGRSARTDLAAVAQLDRALGPFGYRVRALPVQGCLHLKSAVTRIGDDVLLINRQWVDADDLRPFNLIDIDPAESFAANALRVGAHVIYPAGYPRTRGRLEADGFQVLEVDVGELAKAEGAVTCCSLIIESAVRRPS